MAGSSLSDILTAIQNGVVALNNLGQQTKGTLNNILSQLAANASAIAAIVSAYVTSIAGNSGAFTLSTGITNSVNDIRLSLTNATLQTNLANPTGTASLAGVMMGLGGTFKLTPVYSSRVYIILQGSGAVTVATAAFLTQLRFGTGSAPANAVALTGTTVGSVITGWSAVANAAVPFCMNGVITGLTPGTAYWFDAALGVSAGTGTITGLSCTAVEF